MLHENDFIRFQFDHGKIDQPAKALVKDWPPPEELEFMGFQFKRLRYSELTDEQMKEVGKYIIRGAEYEVQVA